MHVVIKVAAVAVLVLGVSRPGFRRWLWWRVARNEARRLRPASFLCPVCVRRLPIKRHFCFWCGSPVSGFAATGPIESVATQGALYRRAASRPTPFVLFGLWLLALPGVLTIAVEYHFASGAFAPEFLASLPVLAFPAAIAVKATGALSAHRPPAQDDDA